MGGDHCGRCVPVGRLYPAAEIRAGQRDRNLWAVARQRIGDTVVTTLSHRAIRGVTGGRRRPCHSSSMASCCCSSAPLRSRSSTTYWAVRHRFLVRTFYLVFKLVLNLAGLGLILGWST